MASELKIKKNTQCFVWLIAGHPKITHGVRSRESVDRALILFYFFKMIIV